MLHNFLVFELMTTGKALCRKHLALDFHQFRLNYFPSLTLFFSDLQINYIKLAGSKRIEMKRIIISARVKGHYLDVMDRFDKDLFQFLLPPILPVRLVEFGGSKKGDTVHLRFLAPFRADWISLIVEDGSTEHEAFFVDEGVSVPFGISSWHHRHMVRYLNESESLIIDDIHFSGQNRFMTFLLYPMLYLSFLPRRWLYKKYFGRL